MEAIKLDLQRMTIGQMARVNKVTEPTLRLYDRLGLLKPQITDPQSGYRYYCITQSARLDMIQYMKSYGMTLQQIAGQLSAGDNTTIQDLLQRRYDVIDREIDELQRSKKAIARTLENYHRYESLPKDGRIFLEYVRPRRIFRHRTNKNFFDQDYANYEYMLRELKGHLLDIELSITYFCNVGTIVRREQLLNRAFYSDEVFVFLDDDYPAREGVETLPAATCLAVCCNSFDREREYAERLFHEIQAQHYTISGDYICEVIAEFPVFEPNRREMFFKIQIPIC